MESPVQQLKDYTHGFSKQIAKEMLKLSTHGFGLVAALAWNEVIKTLVKEHIKPVVGGSSEIISLLIYAIIVTFLAVTVTYNLSKFVNVKKKKKK